MNSMKNLILFLIFLSTASAHATLGDQSSKIADEGQKLGFSSPVEKAFSNYKQFDFKADSLQARQFANIDGKIFALTWTGKLNDQLTQLLGVYSSDLEKYYQAHPKRTGRIPYQKFDAGGVTFEFWDLPKIVKGRAYITAELPSGVTIDNLTAPFQK